MRNVFKTIASIMSFILLILSTMPIVNANTISELETKIKDTKAEIEKTKNDIQATENDIETKTNELIAVTMELEELEIKQSQQYEDMKLRIQYLYENGENDYGQCYVN